MGIWGGIKNIGKKAGRWVGEEVGRVFEPLVSATEGDWRGALSGIGHNVKRAGQAGALFGRDDLRGIDVDVLGAAGGAIEGGLGPSQYRQDVYGDTGSGGFAGALRGGAGGLAGVAGAKTLHHIGGQLGINERLGEMNPWKAPTELPAEQPAAPPLRLASASAGGVGGVGGMSRRTLDAQRLAGDISAANQPAGSTQVVPNTQVAPPDAIPFPNVSFPMESIPQNVIPESSYMNAPAAVGPPLSAPPQISDPTQYGQTTQFDPMASPHELPGAFSPETPSTPFPMETVAPNVIDPSSYMNAPASLDASGTPIPAATSVGSRMNRSGGGGGGGDPTVDDRSWLGKGFDYLGANPEIYKAIGSAFTGGDTDVDRWRAQIQQQLADQQAEQQAWLQSPEYYKQQMLLRGPTSRWA